MHPFSTTWKHQKTLRVEKGCIGNKWVDCSEKVQISSNWHCVKSVRIMSYSGPYSVRMRDNADQNNSEYGHFLRSVDYWT